MDRRLTTHAFLAATLCITSTVVRADIIGFTDAQEWKQTVGSYETIDFTGWPQYKIITDQYRHLGVVFTDGNDYIFHTGNFLKDGAGLHGSWADRQITVQFDSPQLWVGVDHMGPAAIDLYAGDDHIGTFIHSWSGVGLFTGVVSTVAFDRVRIHRDPWGTTPVIDDLHWGIPAPGALAVLGFAALLGPSRRRRHGATRLRDDGHGGLA